jgi:hypothetical protein
MSRAIPALTEKVQCTLERPPVLGPLDSFSAFYGTQRFITTFTRALHMSLSRVKTNPDHTTPSYLSKIHHLCLGLPTDLLPPSFPTYNLNMFPFPHSCFMPHPSHHPRLDHSNYTWQSTHHTAACYAVFSTLPSLHPSSVKIFSSAPCSQTQSVFFP